MLLTATYVHISINWINYSLLWKLVLLLSLNLKLTLLSTKFRCFREDILFIRQFLSSKMQKRLCLFFMDQTWSSWRDKLELSLVCRAWLPFLCIGEQNLNSEVMSKENKQKSGKKNKHIENIEQSSHLTMWTSVGMETFHAHTLRVTDNQLLIWNSKEEKAPLLKEICRIWTMTALLKVHWLQSQMTPSRDGDWRVDINQASHRYVRFCREERCGGAGGFISANEG